MSDSNIQPGGIHVDEMLLLGPSGSSLINLNSIVSEFNIYESFNQPFMAMDIIVNDALALTTQLPIVGSEYVKLKFRVPVPGMDERPFVKLFRVFAINRFDVSKQVRSAEYILRCYEVEKFTDLTKKVRKAYMSMPMSDAVKDILKNFLNVPDDKITVEPTEGQPTIVVPALSPSSSIINLIARFSKSKEYGEKSDYIFYSNQSGFFFRSLQQLMDYEKRKDIFSIDKFRLTEKNVFIKGTAVNVPIPKPKPSVNLPDNNQGESEDDIGEQVKPLEWLKVNDFSIVNKLNIEKSIEDGMFDNTVFYTNPNVSVFSKRVFNYIDEFKNMIKISSKKGFPTVEVDSKDFKTLTGESKESFVMTNEGDQNVNPDIVDNRYQYTGFGIGSKAMLSNIMVDLTVPGDNTRQVGDIIEIDFPEFGGTDDVLEEVDKFISGYYVVGSVRHIYNVNSGYIVVMRCLKNCFEYSVDDVVAQKLEDSTKPKPTLPGANKPVPNVPEPTPRPTTRPELPKFGENI